MQFTLRPLFLGRKNPPHPLNMQLGRQQIRSSVREKSLATAGNRIVDSQNLSVLPTSTTLRQLEYHNL
jgi:hypothetical protein